VRKTFTAASGATLGDPVALGDDRLLLGDERGAHRGVARDPRSALGSLRGADRLRDVCAVEQHAVAQLDIHARGNLTGGRVGGGGGGETHAAVHRPRVQVREAEALRDRARHGGLSGPGGTVDGDDHGKRP
jgi:hypothetical protein